MNIPLVRVDLTGEDLQRLAEVARSGWLMQGTRVEAFEKAVANRCKTRHAVAVSSGTTALHLALLLAGVGEGNEVIVPSFSWIASTNGVVYCGARPIFCDVDEGTYNMTPQDVASRITSRTKAILLVHQFGMPCDLEGFRNLAQEKRLELVEDAACAIGSEYLGAPIGQGRYSRLICFSFHPRKVVTTGEGGMLLTDDTALAEKARSLRNHGSLQGKFPLVGYNYRLTDLQASLGIGQIERLTQTVARRREIAGQYRQLLDGHPSISLPAEPSNCQSNWQSFMVMLRGKAADQRDQIAQRLAEKGIATRPGIAPAHLEPCYTERCPGVILPVTERLARQGLILPLFGSMTHDEILSVASQLKELAGKSR